MSKDVIDTPVFDMSAARAKWKSAGFDGKKAARKTRETTVAGGIDGRSLRATGRTEQFNIRCVAGLKQRAMDAADNAQVTLAEWMEAAVEAAILQQQSEVKS